MNVYQILIDLIIFLIIFRFNFIACVIWFVDFIHRVYNLRYIPKVYT